MSDCMHGIEDAWCDVCHPRIRYGKAFWGSEVFQFIPTQDEDIKISAEELADSAGLTVAQIAQGVAYLRENHPEFPLLSSPQGYWFSLDEAEITKFRRARARSANTTIRRLWRGVLKPYLSKNGRPDEARIVTRQFERMLEDIGDLIA